MICIITYSMCIYIYVYVSSPTISSSCWGVKLNFSGHPVPSDQLKKENLPQPMQPSPKPMRADMCCQLRSMHGYPVQADSNSGGTGQTRRWNRWVVEQIFKLDQIGISNFESKSVPKCVAEFFGLHSVFSSSYPPKTKKKTDSFRPHNYHPPL